MRTDGEVTPEQRELVRLIAAGRTNQESAKLLLLSERTVYRRKRELMDMHNLPNTAALAALAATLGWLAGGGDPPDSASPPARRGYEMVEAPDRP